MAANTVVFEWADYEDKILSQSDLEWDADFHPQVFSFEQSLGYPNISIFVDSIIADEDLERLAAAGLKQIVVRAAGTDMLNIDLAAELDIRISSVPNYSPESIAEYTFALILGLRRRLMAQRNCHRDSINLRDSSLMGKTLNGKTLGLYGIGRIGSVVSEIAQGFGMDVIYFDKYVEPEHRNEESVVTLAELFTRADVISIHVPLTEETKYSVNSKVFESAKPGLTLINVARGDVVDSDAAIKALEDGILDSLGVDVWDSGQTDDIFDPRLFRDDAFQSHHTAFLTEEAVAEILRVAISACD